MFVTWKRNVLFETAVFFAERWRHLTYSNEPNFINNALLVAKEYFHFKLSNVTKRATVACAQCALRTAVLACSQCALRTEAPSNGLRKYHRRERTNKRTAYYIVLKKKIHHVRIILRHVKMVLCQLADNNMTLGIHSLFRWQPPKVYR